MQLQGSNVTAITPKLLYSEQRSTTSGQYCKPAQKRNGGEVSKWAKWGMQWANEERKRAGFSITNRDGNFDPGLAGSDPSSPPVNFVWERAGKSINREGSSLSLSLCIATPHSGVRRFKHSFPFGRGVKTVGAHGYKVALNYFWRALLVSKRGGCEVVKADVRLFSRANYSAGLFGCARNDYFLLQPLVVSQRERERKERSAPSYRKAPLGGVRRGDRARNTTFPTFYAF